MRLRVITSIIFLFTVISLSAQTVFLETEGFGNVGGWTNDNQSMAQMGSPYLIAHGMGRPVEDAATTFTVKSSGTYRLWVRTRDWTRTWGRTESPGRFQVLVNGEAVEAVFGTETEEWAWQDGGKVELTGGENRIALHDLTGFDGRCDAIFLTKNLDAPAPDADASFRRKALGIRRPTKAGKYDFVVVGGGIAGICAAITAARLGSKVALIQNRPVLGGNNSSEVRVGLSGLIYKEPYPELGRLMDEIGGIGHWTNHEARLDPESPRSKHILEVIKEHPEKLIHNAGPASNYEDDKKLNAVLAEPNITLFLNKQVISAKTRGGRIRSVVAKDISTSEEIILKGELFADCTGDANLGYMAGADYRMGRESKAETGETQAPDEADMLTMGTSVQWYASEADTSVDFPECPWAIAFNDSTCIPIVHGEWDWETGLGRDQVEDIERIRDHGLRAVYGNWSYLKNSPEHKEQFENKRLEWVACIGGKRESRRLMGDVILKEQDITEGIEYDDATFTATWGMDLHYPKAEPGLEGEEPFRAISVTKGHKDYAVPYRCLYSRNISNLMMAGRDISVTHAALGTIRVMRTGGMMGEVIGMAASICKSHDCSPRGVYESYLEELKGLMKAGVPKSAASQSDDGLAGKIASLPETELNPGKPSKDWLIDGSSFVAEVGRSSDGKDIIITNGLVSRVFRVFPNLATTNIYNNITGESMVRTASPEGTLTIDGKDYPLGGLDGIDEYAYAKKEWIDSFVSIPNSFKVTDFRVEKLKRRMEWNRKRWALIKDWDPKGKELIFTLEGPEEVKGVKVELHYELYDGAPILGKWLNVYNESGRTINLDKFTLEELAIVEYESNVDHVPASPAAKLHVESDWAQVSCGTTYWEKDPRYTTQVNYSLNTPCLLVSKLPHGPDETIENGGSFESYRNWLMPLDSEDRERKGLSIKRFRTTLAPWTTENPIFLHCTTTKPDEVKTAIDQCAETGYEMVILSFGSGLDMEDESEENIAKFKELTDYAHSKGIEIGGYSLLASRWISDDVDIINPQTGKRGGMTFGSSPCLSSEWGHEYFRKIKSFFEKTGMDFFEHDGSYSGDPCASTSHAYHKGLEDSQWKQRKMLEDLYKWMRAKDIYMNVPDDGTLLIGSTKGFIGYREVNWSLPRDRQIILGRQNIYDGTWRKVPTASWTFTPLVQYHGGGAAATLEPLDEHLDAYKAHMIQNYGSGVQSCYRGFRLYDTERTKEAVIEVINWYKTYRDILCSDIVHLRRADGRDWDGMMHVNPNLPEKGFAMLYNPTDQDITRTITLPLYYTGLTKVAKVSERDGKPERVKLDREYNIKVTVSIPANGYNWLVIR